MTYVLQFGDIERFLPLVWQGAIITLQLTAAAIIGGFAVGLVSAVGRGSKWSVLRVPAAIYVEVTRNTPLLVQIFFAFFALPSLGLRLTPLEAAFFALIWNNGAYMTEILRAGLVSVHRSQLEAGQCLGMSWLQVFVYVQLPTAIANVYPAMVGQFMIIFLNSSVASTIGVEDLMGAAGYIQSETLRAFEIYLVTAAAYVSLGFVIRGIFAALAPDNPFKRIVCRWVHALSAAGSSPHPSRSDV
ncbi:amino acid ABC transporter membrane protein 1 (PAAT family) [Ancylobacter aquaticus]|uniref:Amino acid ABC transporter membrane protein 1 (PAAT family) n=1 Tax=Ancylobacter aquaticus TaxID=100 RepID=A0A4V2PH75_ANCAQ|nr:amino acid ABC transporter permease [Ancylobacter aquaticus]TCK19636.1 amino acid ABC transporter membrane protein 1 (PAAT family) [Ancylobacter aquaticus]